MIFVWLMTLGVCLSILAAVWIVAPSWVLEVIVRLYRKDDERRQELIAERYAVPSDRLPGWVAEQFGVAVRGGLIPRFRRIRHVDPAAPDAPAADEPESEPTVIRLDISGQLEGLSPLQIKMVEREMQVKAFEVVRQIEQQRLAS